MWKLVIALCLFSSNGELLEHTKVDSIGKCLEMKRVMMRNMNPNVRIMCGEVEGYLEEVNGTEFLTAIRKTK